MPSIVLSQEGLGCYGLNIYVPSNVKTLNTDVMAFKMGPLGGKSFWMRS